MKRSYCVLFIICFGSGASAETVDPYAAVRSQIETCVACHGPRGAQPILPEYPVLAGQHSYYLYVQLKDFKAGRRENPIMQPLAAALEKSEMKLIGKYFSEQPWPQHTRVAQADDERAVSGIINSGQCPACHLGGFEGNSRVPWTRGQSPAYLEKTLLDFKHRRRNNAPDKGVLMETFDDDALKRLANYIGSLPVETNDAAQGAD